MRKYLGVVSVIIFVLTFIVLQLGIKYKIRGNTGNAILIIGIGLSVLTAFLAREGGRRAYLFFTVH